MTAALTSCTNPLCTLGRWLWLAPRRLMVLLLRGYRRFISPLYGDVCRFYPTCSAYAQEAYERRGFVVGTGLTVWRLLRCQPFNAGGVDPVPEPHRHRAHDAC
ncbi:MAG: membrane protein insertion efficiency factor YidD [Pseudoclavibacter caeni]|jgi:uncharacterized protein